MCKRQSTPPPANTITILAADILATRATQLLEQLAAGSWEPARKLKEALATYSEVRLGVAMAEGAEAVLRAIDEKAPPTERSVRS
jgi:hypothetical protein